MTDKPMAGVRILEVAQFTFVPAAGAILADWGAEVVKIEHSSRGDAARGQTNIGSIDLAAGSFRPIFQHPNRGKRSVGLDLAHPAAKEILYDLARRSDVFLTNFLPDALSRLEIDVEHIRAVNPSIVYARGSGYGARGPDAGKPAFDATAFWARGGSSFGVTPPGSDRPLYMPAGAYGDSMGGITVAAGIAGALYARATTGEGSVVDVSLLATGAWAAGLSVNLSLLSGDPMPPNSLPEPGPARNPIYGAFRTADDRWIQISMLQAGRYWADVCRHIDRPELIEDERFDTLPKLMANAPAANAILVEAIAAHPLAHWQKRFETLEGAWAIYQNSLEVAQDPQLRANGYIAPVTDVEGNERELLANPVQFDETPPALVRAPEFAEHTDDVLRELGIDEERLIELKLAEAIT
ncbi:CoA transferase [Pseudonocardia xishanensis]|uniref:CoA transferase n=1 Tax=Pseudonocardia xishanensis TaxID=630995 RepID=A0ABP8RUQ0_9PSEU